MPCPRAMSSMGSMACVMSDLAFGTGPSGVVRAPWRTDPHKRAPARGIAGWEGLFQALVDIGLRHLVVRPLRQRGFNALPMLVLHAPGVFAAARTSQTSYVMDSCLLHETTLYATPRSTRAPSPAVDAHRFDR